MRIIVGPPVRGDNFMFREREVAFAKQSLADGTSLLVKGWRRIGKSSLLEETSRLLNEEKIATSIVLDVQDLKSISELFVELLKELPQENAQVLRVYWGKAKQLPNNFMNAIQKRIRSAKGGAAGVEAGVEFDETVRDYWDPLKDSVEALAKKSLAEGQRIVLMIDELPFFLENLYRQTGNVDDVRLVLATLRAWRSAGLTMAIAGSVSIEAFLEDVGVEGLVINDLVRLDLKPLKPKEAEAFVETLADVAGMKGWNGVATNTLLSQLPDHFPFFIQNAMNTLRVETGFDDDTITEAFETQIYPQLFAAFFQQFDERLDNRFQKDERKAAVAVLNAMAKSEGARLDVPDINGICEAENADPLKVTRRLELAEFISVDVRNSGYKLAQNLLITWRNARGGV